MIQKRRLELAMTFSRHENVRRQLLAHPSATPEDEQNLHFEEESDHYTLIHFNY